MRWIFTIVFLCALSAPLLALDFEDAAEVQVRSVTTIVNHMVVEDKIVIDALYPAPPKIIKKIYHISFDAVSCKRIYSGGRILGWEFNLPAGIRRFVDYFLIDIDDSKGISFVVAQR
ncbi:hypothetical protein KA005_48170 [bacterium]|nr:hypothetical protein [bacterium]